MTMVPTSSHDVRLAVANASPNLTAALRTLSPMTFRNVADLRWRVLEMAYRPMFRRGVHRSLFVKKKDGSMRMLVAVPGVILVISDDIIMDPAIGEATPKGPRPTTVTEGEKRHERHGIFEILKQSLVSPPILTLHQIWSFSDIYSEASKKGLGCDFDATIEGESPLASDN
ncbi:hypothetical protein Tco_1455796 [Tanacetum coccineum]